MEPREIIKRVRQIQQELSISWQANKEHLREEAGKSNLRGAVTDTVSQLFAVLDAWPKDMEGHFTIVQALEWLKGDVLFYLGDAAGKEERITGRIERSLEALGDATRRIESLAVAA